MEKRRGNFQIGLRVEAPGMANVTIRFLRHNPLAQSHSQVVPPVTRYCVLY